MDTFAPKHIRPYRRFSNRMAPLARWLWFLGVPVVLGTVFLFGHDSASVLVACLLTIYPALLLMLAVPAFEGLWKLALRAPAGKSAAASHWLWFAIWFVVGMLLFLVGIGPLVAALWHLLRG
jgi:hypothetical protein